MYVCTLVNMDVYVIVRLHTVGGSHRRFGNMSLGFTMTIDVAF